MNTTRPRALPTDDEGSCVQCTTSLARRRSFHLRSKQLILRKCARCSLIDGPLLSRSMTVALIVGTALTLLNHGEAIFARAYPWSTSWHKVILTYVVPFVVASYGALANGYRPPVQPLGLDGGDAASSQ